MPKSKWTREKAERAIGQLFIRTDEHSEVKEMYERLKENAKRDGVRMTDKHLGYYGEIDVTRDKGESQKFRGKYNVPVRYDISLHDEDDYELSFCTMVHELAHLYCGHIGTPNKEWWQNRKRLGYKPIEIEAESVAYLVCKNLKVDNYSREYLAVHIGGRKELPAEDSLDCIVNAANLIEEMCIKWMEPRDQANFLFIETMLLDGMITFLVPSQPDETYAQAKYTAESLKMEGSIKGYWYVQAKDYSEWESIISALEQATYGTKNEDKKIKPTRESWNNIDKVTKMYDENRHGTLLNRVRRVTKDDIEEFKRLRSRQLSGDSLHIHTMIQGLRPGLIAWAERQPANKRLRLVKLRKPAVVKEWHEDSTKFLYKVVKTKAEAERFLDRLEKSGWELYGYTSGMQDVRESLTAIQES